MTHAGFVLAHLRARPLRTALTALAFGLSVGLIGFLFLLDEALRREWSPFMGQRLIVMARTSFFDRLPIAYLSKIEAVPGVHTVVPMDFVMATWRDNRPENQVPLQAAPPAPFLTVYMEADVPKEQAKAWLADPTGALVGPLLAEKHGWKLGDRIVLKAPVRGGVAELTVRAVMGYRLDAGVYIHRRTFEQMTGDQGLAAMYWVLTKTRGDVDRVTATLERDLANAPVPARAMTERQWQLSFLEMIGNVKLLLGSIGLATAFALLLVTSNSLAMSARERRGETAVLRVLGFSRASVAGFLLGEALAYGIVGAALGTGLVFAFGHFVGAALDKTQYAGIGGLLVPQAANVAFVSALSIALALASGIVPATGLSRASLSHLLRETR